MITTVSNSAKAVFSDMWNESDAFEEVVKRGLWSSFEVRKELCTDVFSIFYEDSPVVPPAGDVPVSAATAMALLSHPDIIITRRMSRGSKLLSFIATVEFMESLNRLLVVIPVKKTSGENKSGTGFSDSKSENPKSDEEDIEEAGKQIHKKVRNVKKAFDVTKLLFPGAGWDLSMGKLTEVKIKDLTKFAAIAEKLDWLKKLVDFLGRIKSDVVNLKKKWEPTSFYKGEVFSVKKGGDISKILPSNLIYLKNRYLKLLFYQKLFERSLLVYDTRNFSSEGDKKRGGPILIMLDTSGSMKGEEELISKAFVVAMANLAMRKSRELLVGIFGSSNEYIEYKLVKGKVNISEFLAFLYHSYGGGTSFDVPLRKAHDRVVNDGWKSADIVFVTDGLGLPSPRVVHSLNLIKEKHNTKLFAIIINQKSASSFEKIADTIYFVSKFELQGIAEFIAQFEE